MSGKNYAVNAADDLFRLGNELAIELGLFETGRIALGLAEDVLSAPKFALPDNGRLIYLGKSQQKPPMELCKLPFPVTVIEYEAKQQKAELIGRVQTIPSPRRLAVCYNLDSEVARERVAAMGLRLPISMAGVPGCILVFPVNDARHSAEVQSLNLDWMPNWFGAVVRTSADLEKVSKSELSAVQRDDMDRRGLGENFAWSYEYDIALCGEYGEGVVAQWEDNEDDLRLARARDAQDEVTACMEMCIALSCRNVKAVIEQPSEALNKKRSRTGKRPLQAYHILTVDTASAGGGSDGSDGGGASGRSVRAHLRRGHIRRLESGPIWINATTVNAGAEFVEKEYRVK